MAEVRGHDSERAAGLSGPHQPSQASSRRLRRHEASEARALRHAQPGRHRTVSALNGREDPNRGLASSRSLRRFLFGGAGSTSTVLRDAPLLRRRFVLAEILGRPLAERRDARQLSTTERTR